MRTRAPACGGRPHDAVGKRGGKQLDIIGRQNVEHRRRFARRQFIERIGELAYRRDRRRRARDRRRATTPPAPRGAARQSRRARAPACRCFRAAAARRQAGRTRSAAADKLAVGKADTRIGAMQVDRLPCCATCRAARGTLRARAQARRCRAAGAVRARPRARARQPRARGVARAEPQQRMLEQREQRHRSEPAERGFGRQPGENSGRRFGERIAAGILRGDVPALERGDDAPCRARGPA